LSEYFLDATLPKRSIMNDYSSLS